MRAKSLRFFHIGGLKPFRTLDDVERYLIAFGKGFKPIAGDCGEMAKNILATFLFKKTKPLLSLNHFTVPVTMCLLSPDF
jgi:hypothetical protein